MRNLKRRLASLLALVMLFSMLPVNTLAADPPPVEDMSFDLMDPAAEPEEEPLYVEVSGEKVYLIPDEASTFSMLPLEEKRYTLNLDGYFDDELKSVSFADFLGELASYYPSGGVTTNPNDIAAWAKWQYYDEEGNYLGSSHDDEFTVVGADKTIDLSYGRKHTDTKTIRLELIIGNADQFDPNNTRYIVSVRVGGTSNIFFASAYSVDDPRQEIDVHGAILSNEYGTNRQSLQIPVDPKTWRYGEEAYLGLTLNSIFDPNNELTVSVYSGRYDTEVAAVEAVAKGESEEITGKIWNQFGILSSTGGYRADYGWKENPNELPQITVVFYRNGRTAEVMPLYVEMFEDGMWLDYNSGLYVEENGFRKDIWGHSYNQKGEHIVTLDPGYPANGTYYFNLILQNPKDYSAPNNGIQYVAKAVVGDYDTAEQIPASAVDIKDQLFSNANVSGGYVADYSNGVSFTVVDTDGFLHWFTLKTKEGKEPDPGPFMPSAPRPLSEDTYFRMQKAVDADGNYLDYYVMPYDADGYYFNGFQTVFLLKEDGSPVDPGNIKPVFYPNATSNSKVTIFAGHNEYGQNGSALKQESGVTEHVFESGKAIQYSAAAENERNLKNYWVTFLTKQVGGAKLFVNGINEESLWEEETPGGEKIPVREVFLTNDFNYRHDVFFANIGDAELTNISVKLVDAQNVALDEYWTVREGSTAKLAAFNTTDSLTPSGAYASNGEIPNVAKIRLVPERDEGGYIKAGEISGTLVITADGQTPVRIKLKGTAGTPKITTETVRDGVKYVHYSSLIQTNNMYDSGAVTFSVTGGRLPRGMNLKANGELYGVPTETGTFTFTATATIEVDGKTYSDSKEFTFTIADNTKENVELGNDDTAIGYPLLDRILDLDISGEVHEDYSFLQQNMRSNGPFNEFMNVYLDGRLLADGQDYDAEEGSTRITVRAQTFRNAGNGTHTISAEFRTGQDENGTMHRTAQNFTLAGLPSSGGSSGGGGGGSSSESGKYNITMPTFLHGKVTVDPKTARQGTVVYLTVTPDEGYQLDSITITGPRGKEVAVTREDDGRYSFVMPNGTAQIAAKFVPVGSGQPEQPTQPTPAGTTPFVDMLETDWFYSAVAQVYEKGWMTGTAPDNFAPRAKTSRGMIVTILHKLEGNPEAEGSYFSDVPLNCYYTRAVSWAAEQGIISGYGDGRFGPDDSLTREQIVMILYSYAKYKGMDVSAQSGLEQFTDLDQLSSEAQQAMSWAHGVGLISGKGDGILDPAGPAIRAEMAALLVQFVSLMESAQ